MFRSPWGAVVTALKAKDYIFVWAVSGRGLAFKEKPNGRDGERAFRWGKYWWITGMTDV